MMISPRLGMDKPRKGREGIFVNSFEEWWSFILSHQELNRVLLEGVRVVCDDDIHGGFYIMHSLSVQAGR